MARRANKNTALPVYVPRQPSRTDIEELLGPGFKPPEKALPRPVQLNTRLDVSAVVEAVSIPAAGLDMPTVSLDPLNGSHSLRIDSDTDLSTVSELSLATLSGRSLPTDPKLSTVDPADSITVDMPGSVPAAERIPSRLPAVGRYSQSTVDRLKRLWITESGEIIPGGRVKSVEREKIQVILNAAEESVYNLLWREGEPQEDGSRLARIGYEALSRSARVNRKTIQRIIAKLIDKSFVEIAQIADILTRTPTLYRAFPYRVVRERNEEKGRTHYAKIGPGFTFVRPLEQVAGLNLSTVVETGQADVSTVAQPTTVTDRKRYLSTLDENDRYLLEAESLVQEGQSTTNVVRMALSSNGLVADSEAVRQLISSCRRAAPDCTGDEIAHFVDLKARAARQAGKRVWNPLGLVMHAVPKCFIGEMLEEYRQQRQRAHEAAQERQLVEDREIENQMQEFRRMLEDPEVSEVEKDAIRRLL
jgi:hypothetical protein